MSLQIWFMKSIWIRYLSDRLSNQVYHYDKEARTLRLATNKFERTISDDIKEKTPEIKEGKAR